MDAAIRVSDQTPLCSAMGIDTIPNTAVGIDTHTKTDNVDLFFPPVAKVMVQLVTNQRAITIMTTAQK